MGCKRAPGLQKRWGLWHIDKTIFGRRICESTGTDKLKEAEQYLARRIEEMRQAHIYGVRPKRVFQQAAIKFLAENQHKRSIRSDVGRIKVLVEHIGDLPLDSIHMGSLQGFIQARQQAGIKTRTINHGLQVVRRIVNLAASEWIDEFGLTWLHSAPKIKLLPEFDLRKPYPLHWDEQETLFAALPTHLKHMALFAVNTGCRDKEICSLRWEWEQPIPELNTSVFVVPAEIVKNKEDRLVVLNRVAYSVIEAVRGEHPKYVFTYKQQPVTRILNHGWLTARKVVGLQHVRVHDLKHTFGRRLRAAGVSYEDRQDLLGHRSGRITTHYSAAEIGNLIEAANRVCELDKGGLKLTLLRCANGKNLRGSYEQDFQGLGKINVTG